MQPTPPGHDPPGNYGPPPGQAPPNYAPPAGYPQPPMATFTADDQRVVGAVVTWARVGAWLSIAAAMLSLVASFFHAAENPAGVVGGFLGAALGVALAAVLLGASNKLAGFAAPGPANIHDLVDGFDGLRAYFQFMGVLLIIALVIVGLGVLLVTCLAASGSMG